MVDSEPLTSQKGSMIEDEELAQAYNLGLDLQKKGDLVGAEQAFRRTLELDPEDHGGVAIRLAALGVEDVPTKMPEAYVATLFDQHADVFDEILVDALGYCVPLLIRQRIKELQVGPFKRFLDLGCGTGLTGLSCEDCTEHRTGVDLSEKILEIAFDRGVYDDLYVGEAVEFLREFEEDDERVKWDLITAADVFPYIGSAQPLLSNVSGRLTEGGIFAFSTETLSENNLGEQPFLVGPKNRFAHALSYLCKELDAVGMTILSEEPITVRQEEGEAVPGHLIVAQRQG